MELRSWRCTSATVGSASPMAGSVMLPSHPVMLSDGRV